MPDEQQPEPATGDAAASGEPPPPGNGPDRAPDPPAPADHDGPSGPDGRPDGGGLGPAQPPARPPARLDENKTTISLPLSLSPPSFHAVAVGGPYRSRSNVSVWDDPDAGSRVTPTSASAWW